MIDIHDIIRQLSANAEAIRALIETISDEQARWKPDPETWSLQEVMVHFYNEERFDFRKHLKEMLNDPPQPWGVFQEEELVHVADCQQALKGLLAERDDSVAWLGQLKSPDWDVKTQTPWREIRAGDVLVSWVEHDFLHVRQINELLHAWNERQAGPYSVQYAGGW